VRVVIIGASTLAQSTAHLLIRNGHDVVLVEREKGRIEELAAELDCGFVHGDGSRPAILREVGPEQTDLLLCLTGKDQVNIIASLVGRSLGFKRVVTRIEDPELEHICIELQLEDTIVPDRTIASYLLDLAEGRNPLEMSAMIRDDARVLSFVVRADQEDTVEALGLPAPSRLICIYRQGRFLLPETETRLERDDQIVVLTHRQHVEALLAYWTAAEPA
jgi:trk system potassium uptake protein